MLYGYGLYIYINEDSVVWKVIYPFSCNSAAVWSGQIDSAEV